MVNDRPLLDLRHFHDICPDKNGKSSKQNFIYELAINMRHCPSSCDSSVH
jgi:hypothetical protein